MGNPKNIITLNGKIYDVVGGTLVNKLPSLSKTPHSSKKITLNSPSKIIDGFIAPKRASSHVKHPSKPKSHVKRSVSHSAQRKLQHSKTLMRGLVRKPIAATKPHVHKVRGPLKLSQASTMRKSTDERHKRAAIIKPHKKVVRFAPISSNVIKKSMPLTVKSPTIQKTAAIKPSHKAVKVSEITKASTHTAEKTDNNLLNRALEKATSHEQVFSNKARRSWSISRKLKIKKRSTKIALTLLTSLVIVGALVWNFWPHIQIKVASVRAGFSASLPGYIPAGFGREAIDYNKGQVSVIYKSNSDDRKFSVKQNVSNWNSEALRDNFVKSKAKQFQTVEQHGKTIYTYDDSSATWVNGGVWYNISGKSSLNNEQLLKIADSL